MHYRLKTPYRDGTTHILLEPLDFLARLAALVPPPRVHLTRYHGFAPHAALRGAITPAGRGLGAKAKDGRHRAVALQTRLDDLGATTQTRVRDRYRTHTAAAAGGFA